MDSRKRMNLCFKCEEKWTPKHQDVCKVWNNRTAKLNMIVELSDDEELVDALDSLDATHDEMERAHEPEEVPYAGAMKGIDFPLDLGGTTETILHANDTLDIQPSRNCMPRVSFVEHHIAMSFNVPDDVDGNSPMAEDEIHWDAQPRLSPLMH